MCGGVLVYAVQAIPPIDADLSRIRREIAENVIVQRVAKSDALQTTSL